MPTPSEADTIRTRLRAQRWIDEVTREEICGYLDPQSPPSPTQYYRWLRVLREKAAETSVTIRCSLAELGVSVATVGGDGAAVPESARRALTDIENAIGIDGAEVVCDLLGDRPTQRRPRRRLRSTCRP
ncbi:MAG: hypothetical protein ABEL51_16005 [Salinibacter sp.]